MHNLDDPTPDDLAVFRDLLRNSHPVDDMSPMELVSAMQTRLEERIPAPEPRATGRPTNGRLWLHEALTAGGFREPEDKHQRADLGDGGELVDLGLLGILVMRHTSSSSAPDFSDERLSRELGCSVQDLERGQRLLDEVALLVGRPATPAHRWWVR